MRIIFDLDGTLICAKRRVYDLFLDLVKPFMITYDKYWGLKLKGFNNESILRSEFFYKENEVDLFLKMWMDNIEQDIYLDKDTVIDGVFDKLTELQKQGCRMYICTARQDEKRAHDQLKKLGILHFFEEIFVTAQKNKKEQLLLGVGIEWGREDWIIGDTGHDINAGFHLGVKTCAVLSGFMSKERLMAYKPDIILNDVSNFILK